MTNEELFAFIKKNPIPVACGVVSLALVAGIYFRSGEVPAAEAELTQKTTEADRYSANIKNAAQLKEQFETLTTAGKEIDARLVRASQLGVNNQYFFKLESETGTKLVDFRQGGLLAVKGKTAYSPVAFTVSVQGDLAQLMRFLRLLESGAHYCRVQSATCLPSSGGNTRRGLLTLTLNLELLGLP